MLAEDLFDIMGNRTRREILRLLSEKPYFMSELSGELDVGQKAVNDHVELLKKAGMVELRVSPQGRGRPRKYIRLSRTVSFSGFLGPSVFRTNLGRELSKKQRSSLRQEFPELFENKIRERVGSLEELRVVSGNSLESLKKFENAAALLRNRISRVYQTAAQIVDELGLDELESAVLIELVVNGGDASRIRTRHPAALKRLLVGLESRNVVFFDRSEGVWKFRQDL